MTPMQARAARACLRISKRDLAAKVHISYKTIDRHEKGDRVGDEYVQRLRKYYEEQGIRFINWFEGQHVEMVVPPFDGKP